MDAFVLSIKMKLQRIRARWVPLTLIFISMFVTLFGFQNCGQGAGNSDSSSIIAPSPNQFSKTEYHQISSDYACEILTNDKKSCATTLATYQGGFENLINPGAASPDSSKKIKITPDLTCSLLVSGELQCMSGNADSSMNYVSTKEIDVNGVPTPVYDYNMNIENLCLVINCGSVQ